jgi:hypothetical protein
MGVTCLLSGEFGMQPINTMNNLQTEAVAELSAAELIEYHEYMLSLLHKMGRKRLKPKCPRPQNLAYRVAVVALKAELDHSKRYLSEHLDRK